MSEARGPVILIVSPAAGHAAEAGQVVAALRQAGVEVEETALVTALSDEPPLGRSWLDAGYRAAVAAGGDGTIGAVAGHLAGTDLPLGILPLGTGNDVARSLGVPLSLDAACDIVARGAVTPIDMGQVIANPPATPGMFHQATQEATAAQIEHRGQAAHPEGSYFLHALTLGLNVEFARLATDVGRRQRLGPLNYAASAIEALSLYRALPLTLHLEGVVASGYGLRLTPRPASTPGGMVPVAPAESAAAAERTITGQVIQLAAVVTPVFGGEANLRLPDVVLRDGLLDFVVIEAMEPGHLTLLREWLARWSTARPGSAAPNRRGGAASNTAGKAPTEALELPGVWRFQARAATIVQPEQVDVTLDGEVRARTPLRIQVAADALRVILPAAQAKEVLGG